jgi:hypothetical protein
MFELFEMQVTVLLSGILLENDKRLVTDPVSHSESLLYEGNKCLIMLSG